MIEIHYTNGISDPSPSFFSSKGKGEKNLVRLLFPIRKGDLTFMTFDETINNPCSMGSLGGLKGNGTYETSTEGFVNRPTVSFQWSVRFTSFGINVGKPVVAPSAPFTLVWNQCVRTFKDKK